MTGRKFHVLVVGPPGSGKSYLCAFFNKKRKKAYDADKVPGLARYTDKKGNSKTPTKAEWLKRDGLKWILDRDRLKALLNKDAEVYVFGLSDNLSELIGLFDKVFYLKADKELLKIRLLSKTRDNPFGKSKIQRDWILNEIDASAEEAQKAGFELIDASLTPKQIFDIVCRKNYG